MPDAPSRPRCRAPEKTQASAPRPAPAVQRSRGPRGHAQGECAWPPRLCIGGPRAKGSPSRGREVNVRLTRPGSIVFFNPRKKSEVSDVAQMKIKAGKGKPPRSYIRDGIAAKLRPSGTQGKGERETHRGCGAARGPSPSARGATSSDL